MFQNYKNALNSKNLSKMQNNHSHLKYSFSVLDILLHFKTIGEKMALHQNPSFIESVVKRLSEIWKFFKKKSNLTL